MNKFKIRILKETLNKQWRAKTAELRKQWDDYQSTVPSEEKDFDVFGWFYDEEKDDMDQDWHVKRREYQVSKDLPKPDFTQEDPEYYDPMYDVDSGNKENQPVLRRVKYGQTNKEISLERELMKLWQQMADIDFFKNEVSYFHDVTYKSAAKSMGGLDLDNLKNFHVNKMKRMLDAQNKVQKDSISATGILKNNSSEVFSQQGFGLGAGMGFFLSGHPIFCSVGDLASQTQSLASKKAREYYKSSGLPKRAGMEKFGKEASPSSSRRRLMKRRGMSDEDISKHYTLNSDGAVLDKKDLEDFGTNQMGECIIANWKVTAYRFNSLDDQYLISMAPYIKVPTYVGDKVYTPEELRKVLGI